MPETPSVSKTGFPTVATTLPAALQAVVGHEINIYWENIFLSDTPISRFAITMASPLGKVWDDKWTYQPVAGDVGDHTLTITVKYQGTVVLTVATTLSVKAATAAAPVARQLFTVGDSITENGVWLAELVNLCNFNNTSPTAGGAADNLTITTIGRKSATYADFGGTSRTVHHEATGGWSADLYLTYSLSPFWFSGAFNFPQYCTTNGLTFAAGDWVLIALGINDVFFSTDDASAATNMTKALAGMDAIIAGAKSVQAGLRFGILLPIPPARSEDPFAYQYGQANGSRADHKRWISQLQQSLMDHYGQAGANNIYICPFHINVDTIWDMQITPMQTSARNTTMTGRIWNALHPADAGQWKLADTVYNFLRGHES